MIRRRRHRKRPLRTVDARFQPAMYLRAARDAGKLLDRRALDGVAWPFRWFYRLLQLRMVIFIVMLAVLPFIMLVMAFMEWWRSR